MYYYTVLFLLIVLICVQHYEWDYINWFLRRLVVCVVRAKRPTLIITLQLPSAHLLVYNYFNVNFSRFYTHQQSTQRLATLEKNFIHTNFVSLKLINCRRSFNKLKMKKKKKTIL